MVGFLLTVYRDGFGARALNPVKNNRPETIEPVELPDDPR
jgi:hypothetical protein